MKKLDIENLTEEQNKIIGTFLAGYVMAAKAGKIPSLDIAGVFVGEPVFMKDINKLCNKDGDYVYYIELKSKGNLLGEREYFKVLFNSYLDFLKEMNALTIDGDTVLETNVISSPTTNSHMLCFLMQHNGLVS